MITVTSAEKNKIEGQMRSALPFINNQVDFEMEIVDGRKGRSILTFKQGGEVYKLPIFYISPSTDDSDWEVLTDRIEEESANDGVFFVKFNTKQHVINNAVTFALTNKDLYQKNMLSEMSRLCSYVDLNSYQIQLFELTDVNKLFDKLCKQGDMEEELTNVDEPVQEPVVEAEETVEALEEEPVAKAEEKPVPVKRENEVKAVTLTTVKIEPKVEKPVKPLSAEEDTKLDSDIRALINDCFGIFRCM